MSTKHLQKLHEQASAAPWHQDSDRPLMVWTLETENDGLQKPAALAVHGKDAALIAAARNALPQLLANTEALQDAEKLLREIKDGKHSIPGVLVQIERYFKRVAVKLAEKEKA